MNDSSPFKRTVVFVDGYSSREVILDAEEGVVPAAEVAYYAPMELLHARAINIGDKEMAQCSPSTQSAL